MCIAGCIFVLSFGKAWAFTAKIHEDISKDVLEFVKIQTADGEELSFSEKAINEIAKR